MNTNAHSHSGADGHPKGHDGRTAIDPVCGMTVTIKPESLVAEHDGHAYYFCSAKCRAKFVADPVKYLTPQAVSDRRRGRTGRGAVDVSDASGNHPRSPRLVSDLRHGARAGDADIDQRTEPGARGHDAPVLDRPGAHRSGLRPRDGQPSARARINGWRNKRRTGSSSRSRRRSCCGPVGRSSNAAGRRSSAGT